MKKDNNDFEKALRKRLQQQQLQPSPALFNDIYGRFIARKKRKQRIYYAIAASVLLLTFSIFLVRQYAPSIEPYTQITQLPDSSKNTQEQANITKSNEQILQKDTLKSKSKGVPEKVDNTRQYISGKVKSKYGLEDGSKVTLAAHSSFTWKSADNKRIISLEGEAFFDVAKDLDTFKVFTNNAIIEVVGTHFLVRTTDKETLVAVREGSVRVTSLHNNTSVLLSKGESVNVTGMVTQAASQANENDFFLVTDVLSFNNRPLKEVFQEISYHYHTEIKIDKDVNTTCSFSGTFSGKDLNHLLDIIAATSDIFYQREESAIIVLGSGCSQ